jgi:hypothetical protein
LGKIVLFMRGHGVTRALLTAAILAIAAGCSASSDVSRELGARCDQQDECDDRCLSGQLYPGGFCSASCDSDSDCPDEGACADVDGGVCLFDCVGAADCAFLGSGWQCRPQPGRGAIGGEVMVCIGPG